MTNVLQQVMAEAETIDAKQQAANAQTFHDFNLPEKLLQSLDRMQFSSPTPVQAQAIPLAMAGRDILGSAQTGTGKTGAFSIPMVARLLEDPRACALVMTPTRELATQVAAAIQQMIPVVGLKTAVLIGGEPMPKQFKQLQMRPRIIVGTPGRINDHLVRQTLNLSQTNFLVLDETDRMLDMGFGIQIDKIIAHLPQKRQTLMFSATLPPTIVKMSGKYLVNPERIAVGSTTTPAAKIKQEVIQTTDKDKHDRLLEQIEQRDGSIIIFVRTKHGADRLADKLCRLEHRADAIHGDLQQRKRDRVIQNFRDKKTRILVATDVAARGLDVPHIEHVINYDLPQVPEDYIHRIGRTARAGAEGCAVNFVSPSENGKWKAIQRLIHDGESSEESFRGEPRKSGNGPRGGRQDFGGRKSFGDNKPFGDRKPFGAKKPFGDKPWGKKEFGNANENRRDRPAPRFSEDRFSEDMFQNERGAPPRERRSFNDDRSSEGNRRYNDRPSNEGRRFNDDRPSGDNRRFGNDRPAGENRRFNDDRPSGERRFGGFGAGRKDGRGGDNRSSAGRGNGGGQRSEGGFNSRGASKPGGFKKRPAAGGRPPSRSNWR